MSALWSQRRVELPDENLRTSYWSFSRRAMACEFTVYLPPNHPDAFTAAEAALDEIQSMEDLLTVYRDDSPMSYVNQSAHQGPVRVDARMFEVLGRAAELHRLTGGAFDVTAGALIKKWGFFRGPRRVPSDEEIQAGLACSGMQHVHLDERAMTVRYDVPGLEINLGAIGKGYSIDRAVRRMSRDFGVHSALMQGGLSSVFGLGNPGDPRGWLVGIKHPFDDSKLVATVRLQDRALGTSGTDNQYFEENGRRYGHILDPRSGRPADGLAAVSVVAADCATADALSTALFVMGLDKARVFCQTHGHVGAVLVYSPAAGGATSGPLSVEVLNLAREDVTLQPGFGNPPTR